MRRHCYSLVAVLLCLAAAAASGAAPESGAPPPAAAERKISLDLRDVGLRQAIRLVFEGSGLQYSVDPAVPDVRVSLKLEDVPVVPALRLLLKQGATVAPGLTHTREGDVYRIYVRPAEDAPPAAVPPVG